MSVKSRPLYDQAIVLDILNSVTYRPGWFIVAEAHKNFEMGIKVTVSYPAVDSSREYAPEFETPVQNAGRPVGEAWAAFVIMCNGCTENELLFKLSRVIMKIEEHEMREFLRVGPALDAPFNPHHPSSMELWSELNGTDMIHDLTFGMA